ncbi:RNA-binding protein 28-like [Lineus longissimus]|uniref:RNA-binding protein 28-like n=1 Tax=Lineus longissimus TaxID=88925 RepID=UPI002B4EFE79
MADEKLVSPVGRTLFIRNLPLTTSNEKLEDIFGNIGPLKKCFVVKEKGKDICKGYGYVTFSLQDDANKAKTNVKIVGGRKVQIDFADKKSKRKQQIKKEKKPVKSALDSSDDEEIVLKDAVKSLEEKSPEGTAEKCALPEDVQAASQGNRRKVGILDMSDLPKGVRRADLDVYLKGTNKHMLNLKFPIKGQEGRASVMFTNKATAMNALMLIKKRTLKGRKLKIDIKTQAPVVNLKKAKLIVRNLSFQCNEENLRQVFSKFGEIAEAIIPLRADGRKIGCGFVQFMRMSDAATATKEMNAKEILGRPVAVDWALDREKYTTLSGANTAKVQDAPPRDVTSKTQESVSDSDESESSEEVPVHKKRHKARLADTKIQTESESSDESEDDISDDDDDDDDVSDDDDDDEGTASDANDDSESDSDDDHDDDDDDDEDDDEDDLSSDEDEMPKTKKKKLDGPKLAGKNVLDEKKTVFIRNISFDTEEEELQEYLGQFGEIEYCRIVTDPNTEHSKGTAFVKFTAEESAANCLEKANEVALRGDSGLVLDKRKLFVIPALSREKAEELRQPRKKEKEDRRNLYLVREGMIRPGTAAAEGLSKADLAKRMKVENVKRQKLKDGNVFVSKTRLCVRNIPPTVDDQALRKVYMKSVDNRNAKITECRIMRDMGNVNAKGKSKSRGYAFVEFTQHEHALKALRNTNNNPEMFGENKRLIVEFSLENKRALEMKQKRIERGKMKEAILKGGEANKSRYEKQATPPQGSKEIQTQAMSGVEAKKGVKGLPSHWGPKIRHKPRGNIKPGNKPKGKLSREKAQKRKGPEIELAQSGGPTPAKKKRTRTRKPQKREQSDDFDSLVNKYKQKIMGKAGKRGTWGD